MPNEDKKEIINKILAFSDQQGNLLNKFTP